MIRRLSFKDANAIWEIINKAAHAYQGVIPDDRYHEPYMPGEELHREMRSITFFGWQEKGNLLITQSWLVTYQTIHSAIIH